MESKPSDNLFFLVQVLIMLNITVAEQSVRWNTSRRIWCMVRQLLLSTRDEVVLVSDMHIYVNTCECEHVCMRTHTVSHTHSSHKYRTIHLGRPIFNSHLQNAHPHIWQDSTSNSMVPFTSLISGAKVMRALRRCDAVSTVIFVSCKPFGRGCFNFAE